MLADARGERGATGRTLRRMRPARAGRIAGAYSPSVSSDALPPAAVVLMVTVFSVVKRGR